MTGSLRRPRSALALVVLCAMLTACGGGGSAAEPDPGPDTSAVPSTAPARPVVTYTGNASPFHYDEATAIDAAALAILAMDYSETLSRNLPTGGGPSGVFDQTFNGMAGGSVRVRARYASNGTGFQIEDYSAYQPVAGLRYDGRLVVEITATAASPNGADAVLGYHNLQITQSKYVVFVVGTLATHYVSFPEARTLDMNLQFLGPTSTPGSYFQNVHVAATRPAPSEYNVSVSGRIYDPTHGYIDWSSTQPLIQPSLEANPTAGGPIGIAADGPALRVAPYNTRWLAAELDLDGDSRFERSRPLAWADVFGGSLANGNDDAELVATIGAPMEVLSGGTFIAENRARGVDLEGLVSAAPGGAFVTHEWKLLSSPLGSHAAFDATDLARAHLSTDVQGEYAIAHTVRSGASSATRRVKVSFSEIGWTDGGPPQHVVGSVRHASVGSTIWFRMRAPLAFPSGFSSLTPQWKRRPTGSSAAFSLEADGEKFSFVPDVPGVYAIRSSASGNDEEFSVLVDGAMTLEAPIGLPGSGAVKIADTDGDGRGDLLGYANLQGTGDPIEYLQTSAGVFSSGSTMPSGIANLDLSRDIDGDGLVDILEREGSDSVHWWKRAADGSYALQQTLPPIGAACSNGVELALSPPGLAEVVVAFNRYCVSNHVVEVYRLSAGAFVPIATVDFGNTISSVSRLNLGDVDGDGRADLILSVRPYTGLGEVQVAYASGANGFAAPAAFFYGPRPAEEPGYVAFEPASDGHTRLATLFADASSNVYARVYAWSAGGTVAEDLPTGGGLASCVRPMDLIGDARPELYLCNKAVQFAADGSYLRDVDVWFPSSAVPQLGSSSADLDGDGFPEHSPGNGEWVGFGVR